jgi:hypothetical protein
MSSSGEAADASSTGNAGAGGGAAAGNADPGDKLFLPKSCIKRIMKLNGARGLLM